MRSLTVMLKTMFLIDWHSKWSNNQIIYNIYLEKSHVFTYFLILKQLGARFWTSPVIDTIQSSLLTYLVDLDLDPFFTEFLKCSAEVFTIIPSAFSNGRGPQQWKSQMKFFKSSFWFFLCKMLKYRSALFYLCSISICGWGHQA